MKKTHLQGVAIAALGVIGLMSIAGSAIAPVMAEGKVDVSKAAFDQLYSRGQGGYLSNCSSCHGMAAEGDAAPALAGNHLLEDTTEIIDTVLNGYSYMPPFGDMLSDDQTAAILTYIRNSWGNEFGAVTEEDVAARR